MGLGLDPVGAAPLRRCLSYLLACGSYAVEVVRATAFWGTILLPLAIVGGLATDLSTAAPGLLVALVGVNVLCILVGRGYRPGE